MVDRRLRYAVDNEVDSVDDGNAVLCARVKRPSLLQAGGWYFKQVVQDSRMKGRVAVSHHDKRPDSSPHVSIRPIHLFL